MSRHGAGRCWDILYALASVNDLPLPNSPSSSSSSQRPQKREREEETVHSVYSRYPTMQPPRTTMNTQGRLQPSQSSISSGSGWESSWEASASEDNHSGEGYSPASMPNVSHAAFFDPAGQFVGEPYSTYEAPIPLWETQQGDMYRDSIDMWLTNTPSMASGSSEYVSLLSLKSF